MKTEADKVNQQIGVREIARLANVSIGTVDRALNGRKEISEKTRQKILRIAEKYGYRPNLSARALAAAGTNLRVGLCIPRELHYFYDQLREGIISEARRLRHIGLEIVYRPVERLGDDDVTVVRSLLDEGLRALILTPGDPTGLVPVINEAENERNVRVVCVASDSSQSARSTAVSVEPRLNGSLAGELMAKFLPARSTVAIITGMLQTEDHLLKVKGFQESFSVECPDGVVTEVIEGHEDEVETFQRCRNLLEREPALSGIYVSTVNCLPVCRALYAAGRAGSVRLIATDLFAEAAPYINDRTITAAIHQRPYMQGQVALRLIVDHFVTGEKLPATRYLSPIVVLRSNLRLFREISRAGKELSAIRL
jgi:LacI family transcriptional regulator